MNKKKVYILEDRGVLFIQGKDSREFLQNLITNDIDKVNETSSCFASLLTPQGKYLFDFLIIKHKNGNNSIIVPELKAVIEDRDGTYSPLALYYLIDNNLIDNRDVVEEALEIIEPLTQEVIPELIEQDTKDGDS